MNIRITKIQNLIFLKMNFHSTSRPPLVSQVEVLEVLEVMISKALQPGVDNKQDIDFASLGYHFSPDIEKRVNVWLKSGNVGLSSLSILSHMLDFPFSKQYYPVDSEDFGRCFALLDMFPEWVPRLGEMRIYSEEWRKLVSEWYNVAKCYADEISMGNQDAPKTSSLINNILH